MIIIIIILRNSLINYNSKFKLFEFRFVFLPFTSVINAWVTLAQLRFQISVILKVVDSELCYLFDYLNNCQSENDVKNS